MTKEISKEVRAKVLALHLGCPFQVTYKSVTSGEYKTMQKDALTIFDLYMRLDYIHIYNLQLILSDLSDISDEDLYAIAALCGLEGEMQIERGNHAITVRDWLGRKLILYVSGSFSNPRITDKDGVEVIEYTIDIIDYLRSRGYMLPYNGIDLFESGIAKRIEKEVSNA